MSKHTPGPWFKKREGWSTIYIEGRIRPGVIQEVAACGPTEAGEDQQEANARLIAAAPELLEALEDALSELEALAFANDSDYARPCPQTMYDIRSVIAKAAGESK